MGQALYRKYRSRSLSEIVGQEHITDTLSQALQTGRISHAYLFTGPRGVGKTSIARILAHELNGLPYEDDSQSHLDIIEIDAASNNGVEDVRDLREKVFVAPSNGKYKVYIIDEVHMLSKAAFNALLKTLEEPPAHAVFILATTEAHKLPETIISRTQRYLFRPIDPAAAVKHLRDIAKAEKIEVSDEALALLAAHGDGSFRDSIGLLDQASGLGKPIELSDVQSLLGIPPSEAIEALAGSLTSGSADVAEVLGQLHQLYAQGFQATAIAKGLGGALRQRLIDRQITSDVQRVTSLLARLLEVPSSHDSERFLEICLLEAATSVAQLAPAPQTQQQTTREATPEPKATTSDSVKQTTVAATPSPAAEPAKPAATVVETTPEPLPSPVAVPEAEAVPNTALGLSATDEHLWTETLNELKKQYNTLYGVARMAKADFSVPGKVTLNCSFAFHQKRLHEAKNRQIIGDIMQRLSGSQIEVDAVHDPDVKLAAKDNTPAPTHATGEPLSAISNIFGGGELLNS